MNSDATYLGCFISDRVNFSGQVKRGTDKANRAFSSLFCFQKRYPLLPFSRFIQLYNTLVIPCLTYSFEVFGWELAEKFDDVYFDHLRRYFSVPKSTSKMALLWITGTYPPQKNCLKLCYKFWIKMASLPETRYEKQACSDMMKLPYLPWFSSMLKLFEKIEFVGNFASWTFREIKENFPKFEMCLKAYFDNQIQKWAECGTHACLTDCIPFGHQPWFLDSSTLNERRTVVKLFLRTFNFESTTGPRHKIPRPERFCQYCLGNHLDVCIGDEKHYFLDCPRFSDARKSVFDSLAVDNESAFLLFTNTPHHTTSPHFVVRTVARFIRTSFSGLRDPFG